MRCPTASVRMVALGCSTTTNPTTAARVPMAAIQIRTPPVRLARTRPNLRIHTGRVTQSQDRGAATTRGYTKARSTACTNNTVPLRLHICLWITGNIWQLSLLVRCMLCFWSVWIALQPSDGSQNEYSIIWYIIICVDMWLALSSTSYNSLKCISQMLIGSFILTAHFNCTNKSNCYIFLRTVFKVMTTLFRINGPSVRGTMF